MDEDGEELYDVDSPAPAIRGQENGTAQRNGRQPLLIGNTNRGNTSRGATPSQDEMAAIHQELAAVRQNQKVISNVLQQIARDNERQTQAYKTLHDRHESSINAILTFLATVYNRSLTEGQTAQKFGSVLAGAFPQDGGQQGNVVDMGDYNEQNSNQTQPFFKRQPLLLKAPPPGNHSTAPSPTVRASSHLSPKTAHPYHYSNQPSSAAHSPAASNRSSQSPPNPSSSNGPPDQQLPEAAILTLINAHNAQHSFSPGTRMDFPEALSHLQTADGQTALTPNQRNDVLQIMAGSSSQSGNNNTLTPPNPPNVTETSQFNMTNDQLAFLGNAIKDQDQKVENLTQSLAPLSPSGSIPGMGGDVQYNNTDLLDIDSIFNSGDYFNDNRAGEVDFNEADIPDFDFGTGVSGDLNRNLPNVDGFDGAADGQSERGSGIETAESNGIASPAVTVEDAPEEQQEYGRGKRRRRN